MLITNINIALSFFMAWFFFKGGMMHKIIPQKELLKKSAYRLLVPYVVFLSLGWLLYGVFELSNNGNLIAFLKSGVIHLIYTAEMPPVAPVWFLLSLFFVRLLFNRLVSFIQPIYITILFALAGFGFSVLQNWGWTQEIHVIGRSVHILIPHYLQNICHGLSLYSLGFYLKEKQFNRVLFIIAVLLFILKFIIPAGIDFRANNPQGSNYILAVIYEIAGCIVINNVFKRFVNMRIPLVTYIGTTSMVYYLMHYPVMYVTQSLSWSYISTFDWWIRFFVLSLVVTLFLIISERFFRNEKLKFIIGSR